MKRQAARIKMKQAKQGLFWAEMVKNRNSNGDCSAI